jgi:hypothetical protein
MKLKHKILINIEHALNKFTSICNLRVLLVPYSQLHGEPITFRHDGLITSHTVNFLEDEKFKATLDKVRLGVKHSLYHEYRIYIALKLAEIAKNVPNGVFVECGVGEGVMHQTINNYFNEEELPPTYLMDTFDGIDIRYLSESELRGLSPEERRKKGVESYQANSLSALQSRFSEFKNVFFIQGSIPDIFGKIDVFNDAKVSFLHIDMNNAYPEAQALKYFYGKMTSPGFILFDDYGFASMLEQKRAIDKVCHELSIPIPISLPTGQGLLIRA